MEPVPRGGNNTVAKLSKLSPNSSSEKDPESVSIVGFEIPTQIAVKWRAFEIIPEELEMRETSTVKSTMKRLKAPLACMGETIGI